MGKILVVGAGIAGATCSRILAEKGHDVTLIEKDIRLGGACQDHLSEDESCFIHDFGPHIFHTKNEVVWNFVNRFSKFTNYQHKVFTSVDGKIYNFPINLNTLSKLFNTKVYSEEYAKYLLNIPKIDDIKNFEDAAISSVGKVVYEKFVKNYTEKQWKTDCKSLPASIFKRVDIRYNYNDGYFENQFQGMPRDGYTSFFINLVTHKNIKILLGQPFETFDKTEKFDKIIYTGGFKGLPYRSTKFNWFSANSTEYAVLNTPQHPSETRTTNFNVLHPNTFEKLDKNFFCSEIPVNNNELNELYPIKTEENEVLYNKLKNDLYFKYNNILFVGRLATYNYYDMDQVIWQAMMLISTNF